MFKLAIRCASTGQKFKPEYFASKEEAHERGKTLVTAENRIEYRIYNSSGHLELSCTCPQVTNPKTGD